MKQVILNLLEMINAKSGSGNAYYYIEEYEKAISDCTKAIELKPDLAEAYKHMGTIYYKLEDYSKAQTWLNQAIIREPKYKKALEVRANVYHALDQHEKAEKDEEMVKNI